VIEISAPSVSVIVPVFRDAGRLSSCLSCLSGQRSPLAGGFEIVVVDNDPVEGAPSPPVAEAVARFRAARVFAQPRPGSYAARNLGVSQARGQVIVFTDADCLPASGWLEAGVARLLDDDSIGIVGGSVELLYADPRSPRVAELVQIVTAFRQREFVEEQGYCATANLFTRRSVFERVGLFEERLLSRGDWEWGRRVAAAGYRLVYCNAARVSHPASGSLRDLVRRTARIAGGGWALQRLRPGGRGSGGRAWRAAFGTLGRSARATWRLVAPWDDLARVFASPEIPSAAKRLTVGGLVVLLSWYGLLERLRLVLGGAAERR